MKQLSPESDRRGSSNDGKEVENERNGKPEECFSQFDSGTLRMETKESEVCPHKSLIDLPGKSLQSTSAPDENLKNKQKDFEKHRLQSGFVSEAENSAVESSLLGKSPQLNSTRVEHLTEEQSFDNSSHTASHYDGNSTCDTPSGINVSSVLETTSLLGGDDSCLGGPAHFDHSSPMRKDTSLFDSKPSPKEKQSSTFNSTRNSSFSEEDSGDDTRNSTREGDTSEADQTSSFQVTGESMLESSLNNTSQIEEPPVDSSVSNSHSVVSSQPDLQGTFSKFIIIDTYYGILAMHI